MSTKDNLNSSDNENLCVVCFKNVDIYSIGICDHPVCFECSTRMRVLCRQNECPICRQDMPKVIFTKTVESFTTLFPKFERSNLQDRKFGLLFCTSDIQKTYYKLLEHRCHICESTDRKWPFKNFQQLKDHMRREHELHYCEICADNLKIFNSERRCYTRQQLALHRRKGDPDNTSHRGHPLCEFCDTRYMDNDELFRHLRRTHFFCHFCDADGKHQYYSSMNDLLRHFKEEHHLCEEGECKAMPMTAVFRTDIDLKAHIATEHGRNMSRLANRQARTLELEFTLAPRPRVDNVRNKRYTEKQDRTNGDPFPSTYNEEPGGPGGGVPSSTQNKLFVNPLTSQDFPALGGATSNLTIYTRPTTTVNFTSRLNSNFSQEDFPSLGGPKSSSAVTITTNSTSTKSNKAPEVTITRTVRGQQRLARTNDNFPALGPGNNSNGSSTVRLSVNSQDQTAPKVSIHVNHRPNIGITTQITTCASSTSQQRTTEAFPALGAVTNVSQPQWVQVKSKKHEPKASKVSPAPQLPSNSLEQFPTLEKGKKSSASMPLTNNWVNLNNINSASSKNLKNDVKPASSKSSKIQDVKSSENAELRNKNKKKKGKLEGDKKPANKCDDKKFEVKKINESNLCDKDDLRNGLVKKRSELKIGSLSSNRESSILLNDITASSDTKPPPGFNLKPPPGLNPAAFPSLSSVANDLTFTSSSGQSYSITPSINYHPPNNFQARNQNLIKRVMIILDNDTIKEFKTYSDLFRNGGFPTNNYYEHCQRVLGSNFDNIFPELLVLLPDIDKQQELYKVYNGKNKKNLIICENCKQVIYKKELSEHYNYHVLENQFQSLDTNQQVNNAWKK